MNEYKEKLSGKNKRVAIVAARYNEFITGELLRGAVSALEANEVENEDIDVWWVPGALEVPPMVAACANSERYYAIVAIGCVIRGETDHYRHVCEQSVSGVQQVANKGRVGIGNAVLTVHDVEQAVARAGRNSDNKGYEAACAALIMANQLQHFPV